MLHHKDLFNYQLRLVQWIKAHPACALWVDMGLGKSVATLTAIKELMDEFEVHKTLVIAPLRVARKTWPDEIEEWSHVNDLRYSRILGTADQRLAGIRKEADIYLINRENVKWLAEQFIERRGKRFKQIKEWPWDTVVIDEASSFKSNKAKRFLYMKLIRKKIDRIVELTGTPSPNGLMDLWAQSYLLDLGERLGQTITACRNRWFDYDPYEYKWKPRKYAEAQMKDALSDIVASMRAEDYLELPPVVNNFIKVDLTKAQWEKYRRFEKQFVLELNNKRITAVNGGVLANKLLQLCNGAVYTQAPLYEVFHDAKIEALLDVIEHIDGPMLVAYSFKSDLIRIKAALAAANQGRFKKTFMEIRDKGAEDLWDAGKVDVLLLHPASAGHGLNLQKSGAETVIWFGLNWSLELYQQTNARLTGGHRRTGKNIVIHHIIAEGTMDEDVVAALSAKDAQQERLLNALKLRVKDVG